MSDPTVIRRVELVQGPPGPQSVVPGPAPVTTTTANFVQPVSNATVNVQVATSVFWAVNQAVFVGGAGDYVVSAVPDATHITLINLDTPGSAAPGVLIPLGSPVTCNGYPGAGTEVTVTTTDATPTALEFDLSWMAPLTTFRLDIVIAARTAADDSTFVLTGLFRKGAGGAITQTGAAQPPSSPIFTSGAAAWTGSLSVTSGGSAVSAMVVGAVSTTIVWGGLAQLLRVTGLS